MAVEVIEQKTCDVHGKTCKSKAPVETRAFFDQLTGKPLLKEMCEEEWVKVETNNTATIKDAREAPVPEPETKSTGGKGKYAAWAPMFDAMRAWYIQANGDKPRGLITPESKVVKKFLTVPAGAAWVDWEPGKPVPTAQPAGGATT